MAVKSAQNSNSQTSSVQAESEPEKITTIEKQYDKKNLIKKGYTFKQDKETGRIFDVRKPSGERVYKTTIQVKRYGKKNRYYTDEPLPEKQNVIKVSDGQITTAETSGRQKVTRVENKSGKVTSVYEGKKPKIQEAPKKYDVDFAVKGKPFKENKALKPERLTISVSPAVAEKYLTPEVMNEYDKIEPVKAPLKQRVLSSIYYKPHEVYREKVKEVSGKYPRLTQIKGSTSNLAEKYSAVQVGGAVAVRVGAGFVGMAEKSAKLVTPFASAPTIENGKPNFLKSQYQAQAEKIQQKGAFGYLGSYEPTEQAIRTYATPKVYGEPLGTDTRLQGLETTANIAIAGVSIGIPAVKGVATGARAISRAGIKTFARNPIKSYRLAGVKPSYTTVTTTNAKTIGLTDDAIKFVSFSDDAIKAPLQTYQYKGVTTAQQVISAKVPNWKTMKVDTIATKIDRKAFSLAVKQSDYTARGFASVLDKGKLPTRVTSKGIIKTKSYKNLQNINFNVETNAWRFATDTKYNVVTKQGTQTYTQTTPAQVITTKGQTFVTQPKTVTVQPLYTKATKTATTGKRTDIYNIISEETTYKAVSPKISWDNLKNIKSEASNFQSLTKPTTSKTFSRVTKNYDEISLIGSRQGEIIEPAKLSRFDEFLFEATPNKQFLISNTKSQSTQLSIRPQTTPAPLKTPSVPTKPDFSGRVLGGLERVNALDFPVKPSFSFKPFVSVGIATGSKETFKLIGKPTPKTITATDQTIKQTPIQKQTPITTQTFKQVTKSITEQPTKQFKFTSLTPTPTTPTTPKAPIIPKIPFMFNSAENNAPNIFKGFKLKGKKINIFKELL